MRNRVVAPSVEPRIPLPMRRSLFLAAAVCLVSTGCIHVKMDPIQVHAVVDVNVKVDRALDDFFGDLDRQSTTINSVPAR